MTRKPELVPVRPAVAEALRLTLAPCEPKNDQRRGVTTAVWSIARACGFEVGDLHWECYPMSFHWVEMRQDERRFALLPHASSPFAALSAALPDYLNLTFFDDAAFAAAAQRVHAPFRLLAASELRQPLTEADTSYVSGLSRQHASDLAYWKPRTVGDVIFNWWD